MQTVNLGDLPEGATYIMPWRAPGIQAGRVVYVGRGSITVHQPKHEGDGWERTAVAQDTQVLTCDPEEYETQGFGTEGAGGRVRNKSTVRKPVDIVWALCDDIIGRGNTPTVEDRNKMVAAAIEEGVNISTARTQYYAWRKKYA